VEQIHALQEDSDIDSNKYEWDELIEHSYEDKGVDTIQTYNPYCEGQMLTHRPLESDLPTLESTTLEEGQSSITINNLEESTILDPIPTNLNPNHVSIQTINESDLYSNSLPFVHPELIN